MDKPKIDARDNTKQTDFKEKLEEKREAKLEEKREEKENETIKDILSMMKDKESAASQGLASPKLTFRDQLNEIEPC